MERISSNATLFFKFFVPIFWMVFMGGVTAVVLFKGDFLRGAAGGTIFKLFMALGYLAGLLVIYFTLFQLKRVEISPDSIYITNYFKHYRYSVESVQKIQLSRFLFFETGRIELYQPGTFGRNLRFLASRSRLRAVLEEMPEWKVIIRPV